MKKRIAALSVSLALSTLPLGAFAHGYDAGDAALGGFVGGVVGGLIGSGRVPVVAAPAPVVVAPARPVHSAGQFAGPVLDVRLTREAIGPINLPPVKRYSPFRS